jgi:ankyrin repeat protein
MTLSIVGNLDIAQLLISHGANANVTDKWGHSPFYLMLWNFWSRAVRMWMHLA